jgi:hypothetical protein
MSALVRGGREVEAATRAAGRYEMDEPVRITAAARRRQPRGPEEDRRYSWLEDHLARLDGKEARGKYYAWLTSGCNGTGISDGGNGP